MATKDRHYHAFISYRHLDNTESGRQWATWLHQAIESYEIPQELVGKKNSRGEEIPERIFPVFRDEEALPADADLSNVITRALDDTELLIVLCSPRARQSSFVADEIRYFKQLGRSDRILAAILDGEPNTSLDDGKQAYGYSIDDECFPEPLQFDYDENGLQTEERTEPVAADFRILLDGKKQQGWTSPQALKQYLTDNSYDKKTIQQIVTDYDKQLRLMLLKIIAGIIGVSLDELTQRDKAYQLEKERKRTKRFRQIASGFAIIAIMAIVTGVYAWQQKLVATRNEKNAKEELNHTLVNQSRYLVAQAKLYRDKGDNNTALLLSLNAMPGLYGGVRPLVSQAKTSLAISADHQNKKVIFQQGSPLKTGEFSPTGQMVLTRSIDGSAGVWSVTSGKQICNFEHNSEIKDAAFSPDGKHVALASGNITTIWSVNSCEQIQQLQQYHDNFVRTEEDPDGQSILSAEEYDDNVVSVKFSPDGSQIIAAANDGAVIVWAVDSGEEILKFQDDNVYHAEFSPDGRKILTLSDSTNNRNWYKANTSGQFYATIWSANSGQQLHQFSDAGAIQYAEFSPDSQFLTTASIRSGAIWSINTGKRTYEFDLGAPMVGAKFSPDGQKVITSTDDGRATIWSLNSGKQIQEFNADDIIYHAEFSPDGQSVIMASDNSATLWAVDSGKQLEEYQHDNSVYHAEFSHDGQSIVTVSTDGSAIVWSISKKDQKNKLFSNASSKRWFSSDWDLVATVSDDTVTIWSVSSGKQIQQLQLDHKIDDVSFSPDRETVTTFYKDSKTTWLVSSGKPVSRSNEEINNQTRDNNEVINNGKKLSYPGNILTITSVSSGEVLIRFPHNHKIDSAVFSPNGEWVVVSTPFGTKRIWSVNTGKQIEDVHPGEFINFVKFSQDGSKALIGSADSGKVAILSVRTGELLQLFRIDGSAADAEFSPDEQYVVIVSYDRETVSVWSVNSGEQIQQFHYDGVYSAEFSPDGLKMATYSSHEFTVWPVLGEQITTDKAIKRLAINQTCLTPTQRKQFFLPELTDQQWIERGCPQYTSE